MRKITFLFAFLAVALASQAYDFSAVAPTGQTLYYNITSASDFTVAVVYPGSSSYNPWSGHSKPTGSLSIPSTVSSDGNDYSVTSIGNYAFYGCVGLTSVVLPDSMITIGTHTFEGCTGLTSATIPNSVVTIGQSAFHSCSGLTSVAIPNSVTTIDQYAFAGCSGLTSVTIPNSVTTMEFHTFSQCSGLMSVTIPNSVTTFGGSVFEGCSSLTSVIIPNSVTTLGGNDFKNCVNLACVTIGNSVTAIARSTFYGCTSLTNVTIPNSVTSIGESAFYNCYSLASITIPDSVTSIGSDAFRYCMGLTSVTFGNSVNSISNGAFYLCGGLTSITIPNSVTRIENSTFYGCVGLTSVTVPNSVTLIGDWAFQNCSSLTSVTIGDSVSTIGQYAFGGCDSLTSVIFGNSVTRIGVAAFHGCSNLLSLSLPNSLISISSYAFYNCVSLSNVIIPNSVISIGAYAFSCCSGLARATIGNSVTSIMPSAFKECSSLQIVYSLNPIAPTLSDDCFRSCSIQEIHIPCGSLNSYNSRWSQYSAYLEEIAPFAITLHSADSSMGETSLLTSACVDTIIISAEANSGYHFAQWSDGVTDNPRSFVLTQDTSFTAEFAINQYVIVGVSSSDPMGSVSGSDTVDYLQSVTLTATANYGYHFTQWNDGVTDNPRTIVADSNKTYTAQFDYNSYAVFKSCDTIQGNVMGVDSADYLSNVVLTAEPNYGYHFTQWSDGVTDNPRTFVLTQDTTFVAEFDRNSYAVTCVSNDVSMGQVQGGGTFLYLDTVALSAVAVEPYRFTHWQDGDTVNPRSIVVYSDTTFTAYFENGTEGIEDVRKNYTLTVVGNAIRISGAMGETVRVFDVVGRQLLKKKLDSEEIRLNRTGVFFIQVGNAPAEKVVLVR